MKKTEVCTKNAEACTNNAEENIRIELSGEDALWLLYAAEKSPEIRRILEAASQRKVGLKRKERK